jgi:hypothetical protein
MGVTPATERAGRTTKRAKITLADPAPCPGTRIDSSGDLLRRIDEWPGIVADFRF